MRIDIHRTGKLSEIKVQKYYYEKGYDVFVPLDGFTRSDFVVVNPATGESTRVQVKTVQENNVGGKIYLQSRLSSADNKNLYTKVCCDVIAFVYKDVIWIAPIEELSGLTSVCLGRIGAHLKEYRPKSTYDPFSWLSYGNPFI
jgi:hypothetical protein